MSAQRQDWSTLNIIGLGMVIAMAMNSTVWGYSLEGRAVWASAGDAGRTEESVKAFAEQLEKAHVNMVVMCVKGMGGDIYWPSEKFPASVRDGYREFDMPAALVRECHARNIQVHAWFCDFIEGRESEVVKQHPDWCAFSPEGRSTAEEILRGRNFGNIWMCPARRPGYTDQWLIPTIVEFAQRYDVDGIHHDYVRYPGDLAPDTYCFCDYCLETIPKYAGYVSEPYPDEPFYPTMDRPHLEAHWETSPRVLPMNWKDMDPLAKSRFLFSGSYFPGGNNDLDYFFYRYRIEAINAFVREVNQAVRAVKPKMEFSAAVFKNAVQSGRFIGQDWREFSDWVDYAMPMDYRAHIPGNFEMHLDLLEQTVKNQIEWAREFKHLWIGICLSHLYTEEQSKFRFLFDLMRGNISVAEAETQYKAIAAELQESAPELNQALQQFFANPGEQETMGDRLRQMLRDSRGRQRYSAQKFRQTLERVKAAGAKGIVVFAAGGISGFDMWDELGDFYAQ